MAASGVELVLGCYAGIQPHPGGIRKSRQQPHRDYIEAGSEEERNLKDLLYIGH